jgi:3-oxoacyl-(acyl-carrier-protein) synthase
MTRIVITGNSAICGAGQDPSSIVDALLAGHSALAPIAAWDAESWVGKLASCSN